jgi:hypothetical protein
MSTVAPKGLQDVIANVLSSDRIRKGKETVKPALRFRTRRTFCGC